MLRDQSSIPVCGACPRTVAGGPTRTVWPRLEPVPRRGAGTADAPDEHRKPGPPGTGPGAPDARSLQWPAGEGDGGAGHARAPPGNRARAGTATPAPCCARRVRARWLVSGHGAGTCPAPPRLPALAVAPTRTAARPGARSSLLRASSPGTAGPSRALPEKQRNHAEAASSNQAEAGGHPAGRWRGR